MAVFEEQYLAVGSGTHSILIFKYIGKIIDSDIADLNVQSDDNAP